MAPIVFRYQFNHPFVLLKPLFVLLNFKLLGIFYGTNILDNPFSSGLAAISSLNLPRSSFSSTGKALF